MMCLFLSLLNRATPLMAMLLVSVAPEVKTMSLASAPIRSATCWKMSQWCPFVLIKPADLPYVQPQWPSLLPIHTHVFDCADCRTDLLGMATWHREHEGLQEWWPRRYQHTEAIFNAWTYLHVEVYGTCLLRHAVLTIGNLELEAKHICDENTSVRGQTVH